MLKGNSVKRKSHQSRLVELMGGVCKECGSNGKMHIHHIVPLSKGGGDTFKNLQLLCVGCHYKKHGTILSSAPTIKCLFCVDEESNNALSLLAKKEGVSRSEMLRRGLNLVLEKYEKGSSI